MNNKIDSLGELELYGRIGDWWDGLNTEQVFAQINAHSGHIVVRVHSTGGSVAEAIALHALLTNCDKEVIVHIDGDTQGAGSIVAMAGDEIIMPKNVRLRLVRSVNHSDLVNKTLMSIYRKRRSFLDDEVLQELMQDGAWITAAEADAFNLITQIV